MFFMELWRSLLFVKTSASLPGNPSRLAGLRSFISMNYITGGNSQRINIKDAQLCENELGLKGYDDDDSLLVDEEVAFERKLLTPSLISLLKMKYLIMWHVRSRSCYIIY
jgi:hypothetical protein